MRSIAGKAASSTWRSQRSRKASGSRLGQRRKSGQGLGRALAEPAPQRRARLGDVAPSLIVAIAQHQPLLAGHQQLGRRRRTAGDQRRQAVDQALVLGQQLGQQGDALLAALHRLPGQQQLQTQLPALQFVAGLIAFGPGLRSLPPRIA
jgi:hypothetical protein